MPASEKIVSLFEPHTDIIVKTDQDVHDGHKINLATEAEGFVTYLNIVSSNPLDRNLFMPGLAASEKDYRCVPMQTVADGGYSSQAYVELGREKGVDRTVFNKRCTLGYHQMGGTKKTFKSCVISVPLSRAISPNSRICTGHGKKPSRKAMRGLQRLSGHRY